MVTYIYGILLIISILVIFFMVQKNYETIDMRYWTIQILIPIVILGYWLKTRVDSAEAARVLFCFIYLDSTVMLSVVVFSILHFMKIEIRAWIKVLAYLLAFAHVLMVWLNFKNTLYYSSITLIYTSGGTATKMTPGPLRIAHWIYLGLVICIIIGLIITAYIRKGTYSRRTLALYTAAAAAAVVVYIAELIIDVNFSALPAVYVAADIMIGMNYDHAHMHDISYLMKKRQKYHEVVGYTAVDLDGRFLSCNEHMLAFMPELAEQIVDEPLPKGSRPEKIIMQLIEDYRMDRAARETFTSGNMICQCEISEFSVHKGQEPQGYLINVRDITEEQKVMRVMQDYNTTLNNEVEQKTEHIKEIQRRVVLGLTNMVENRDSNTGGHVKRTSDVIEYIVEEIQKQHIYDLDEEYAEDIIRAAPMHDLGKITIENSILNKPGRLTVEEFAIMKTHSVKSGEFVKIILKDVEEQHFVDVAFNVARYHHERWDGNGYPEGLVGEMIPLEARIMAIADVYDALVSKRVYKEPMSFEKAAEIMMEGMGSQFDPNMLSAFIGCRGKLEAYYRTI